MALWCYFIFSFRIATNNTVNKELKKSDKEGLDMEDQEWRIRAECRMVLLSAWERGKKLPVGRIIVIARKEKAREYAEGELKPHLHSSLAPDKRHIFTQRDLGGIFLWPNPETIFLYTENAGQIK